MRAKGNRSASLDFDMAVIQYTVPGIPALSPEFLQHSFAFTLRLLARYGESWREAGFYAEAFIRAFPVALDEPPDLDIYPAELAVNNSYQHRALQKFAVFAGLAETDGLEHEPGLRDWSVRKTRLLDEIVRFSV